MRQFLFLLMMWIGFGEPAGALPVGPDVFCRKFAQGTLLELETQRGAVQLCHIERAVIGAATLLLVSEQTRATEATDAFLQAHAHDDEGRRASNPASAYCSRCGGTNVTTQGPAGPELGLCVFGDGSIMEAWTLWAGPKAPGMTRLARFLRGHEGAGERRARMPVCQRL